MLMFFTQLMLILHTFVGVILIGIILLQRGRGGGLAGAFGGMGGQSAFGTKAGDVFTKITIWIATIWIVLGCVCVLMTSNFKSGSAATTQFKEGAAAGVKSAPADGDKKEGDKKDADKKGDEDKQAVPPAPENPPKDNQDVKSESKSDATDSNKPTPESKPEKDEKPAPSDAKKDEAPKDSDKKPD